MLRAPVVQADRHPLRILGDPDAARPAGGRAGRARPAESSGAVPGGPRPLTLPRGATTFPAELAPSGAPRELRRTASAATAPASSTAAQFQTLQHPHRVRLQQDAGTGLARLVAAREPQPPSPALRRAIAAQSPPTPAPTMTTCRPGQESHLLKAASCVLTRGATRHDGASGQPGSPVMRQGRAGLGAEGSWSVEAANRSRRPAGRHLRLRQIEGA